MSGKKYKDKVDQRVGEERKAMEAKTPAMRRNPAADQDAA